MIKKISTALVLASTAAGSHLDLESTQSTYISSLDEYTLQRLDVRQAELNKGRACIESEIFKYTLK